MTRIQFFKFMRTLTATVATGIAIWLLTKLGVNITVPAPMHP